MKYFTITLLLFTVVACSKEKSGQEKRTPEMSYISFGDSSIHFGKFASFDLDSNGTMDIFFSTQLVGDPIEQADKKQWLVNSSFLVNLPVNHQDLIPQMVRGDGIPVADFNGYNWFNAASILLAQKLIPLSSQPHWTGDWKDVSHKYFPLQIRRNNGLYNGWAEISFEKESEKLVLHKAAVSTKAGKEIKAGH